MTIAIKDTNGRVLRTMQGPGTEGFHTVSWNFRADPAAGAQPTAKRPSEVRDSINLAKRADFVQDSLIAAGRDEAEVRRMVGGIVSRDRERMGFGRGFGGFGGGQDRDPEAFEERPGESFGGRGGGFRFSQMREYATLLFPGQTGGVGRAFRRFGAGGQGDMLEPGSYTVTLTLNGTEYSRAFRVERMDSYSPGGGFGFEVNSREAFEEWLRSGN